MTTPIVPALKKTIVVRCRRNPSGYFKLVAMAMVYGTPAFAVFNKQQGRERGF
jgi:hypothetical protein